MLNKFKKRLPLLLVSPLLLPASAMASWPVAIVDKVAAHPAQSSIRIDVLENDTGEGLEFLEVNSWSEKGGQISVTEDHLTYIPPITNTGEDGFWYAIKDNQGRTNAVRIIVDVKTPDTPLPTPLEDRVETPQNIPIRINVLKNDLFSTTTLTGDPTSGGTITDFDVLSENGGQVEKVAVYPDAIEPLKYQLLYTPADGFTGTDTFSYSVKDLESDLTGTTEQTNEVTIEVLENTVIYGPFPTVNPDAASAYCAEGAVCTGSLNYVLRNDIGKNLILKLDGTWSQQGGRAYVSLGEPTGVPSINYVPKASFAEDGIEEDTVYYVIEDEYGRSNWGALTIDVTNGVVSENNAPVASDESASTDEGLAVVITLSADDADEDPLTYIVDEESANGGTISGTGPMVTYEPAPEFVGTDTFTFKVNDGTADSNTATVSVVVTGEPVVTGRYNKLDSEGEVLLASATDWSCVIDNDTGFIWEKKTDDDGPHDKDNTYRWYNPDASENGGNAGGENDGVNTLAFAAAANAETLCGRNDWRLPSKDHLLSLVSEESLPSINTTYFPNTILPSRYWTATTYTEAYNNGGSAWSVRFDAPVVANSSFLGHARPVDKRNSYYVRLVSGGLF